MYYIIWTDAKHHRSGHGVIAYTATEAAEQIRQKQATDRAEGQERQYTLEAAGKAEEWT